MDTPEKNRIAAVSFCNFEDSPVFQYINDLSPIEPVKQARTDNVLHSMAFASPPSIFSSPQINSLRDSRFSIKRHRSPDLSTPSGFLGGTVRDSPDALEAGKASSICEEWQKFEGPEHLDNESEAKPFKEHISLAIELAKSLKNGRDGCDIQMGSCDEASTDAENAIGRAGSMEQSDELCRQPNDPLESDAELDGVLQTNEKEANIDFGLEKITSDVGGIQNNEQHNPKISDPRFSSLASGPQQFSLCYNDSGNLSESGGSCSGQVAAEAPDISISRSSEAAAIDSTAKAEDTEESGFQPSRKQRSVRRRCLTYDVGGSNKRIPLRDCTNDPPIEITPVNEAPKPHKCSDLSKKDTDKILPTPRTIGLHLNGLVNSLISNDRNILICKAGRVLSQGPTTFNRNLEDEFSTPVSTKGELVSSDNTTMEEIPERSMEGESFGDELTAVNGQLSQGLDELGSCKRCRCRKSKCLKLYCDCFAAGLYCIEPCSCQNCFNKPIHENIVMNTRRQIEARNPLAFAPKVISTSHSAIDLVDENNKTPASARHKRGCNCKKSGCLKKYCECFLMGVGCSPSCRCIGCKNVFGQTNEQFHFPCLVESDTVTMNEENRDNNNLLALELNSHGDKTVSSSTKIEEEGSGYEVCNEIIRREDASVAL